VKERLSVRSIAVTKLPSVTGNFAVRVVAKVPLAWEIVKGSVKETGTGRVP
jgi:hypothetical protein